MDDWTDQLEAREDEVQQVEQSGGVIEEFTLGALRSSQPVPESEDEYYYNRSPEPAPDEPVDPPDGSDDAKRLEMHHEMDQRRSFLSNMCAFAILGPDQNSPDSELDHVVEGAVECLERGGHSIERVV